MAASSATASGLLALTHTLVAGDLEVVFLPSHGMLCASLRHKGVEILRRVENLEAAAAKGRSRLANVSAIVLLAAGGMLTLGWIALLGLGAIYVIGLLP